MLRQGWYFWCTCERCVTADEAGAELSTLRCECGGAVRPSDPRDQDTCYSCDTCGRSLDRAQVEATETALKDELELCYTSDTVALENVLNKHKGGWGTFCYCSLNMMVLQTSSTRSTGWC